MQLLSDDAGTEEVPKESDGGWCNEEVYQMRMDDRIHPREVFDDSLEAFRSFRCGLR